jgi:hypothetical protein
MLDLTSSKTKGQTMGPEAHSPTIPVESVDQAAVEAAVADSGIREAPQPAAEMIDEARLAKIKDNQQMVQAAAESAAVGAQDAGSPIVGAPVSPDLIPKVPDHIANPPSV